MQTLFRRLRRWTFYRAITGERHYLLYRGVRPDEVRGVTSGSDVVLNDRTSYTADAGTAFTFAEQYNTQAVGVWVPERAIVTAPFAFGRKFLDSYAHGELEIIVDPHVGVLQDAAIEYDDFCGRKRSKTNCVFRGWRGDVAHPWFQEEVRRLDLFNAKVAAGQTPRSYTLTFLNPTTFRVRPPTSDAKTTRGF